MDGLKNFEVAKLRFSLTPQGRLRTPVYKGSTLRGGFGAAFKNMVCFQSRVKTCNGCLLRWQCPYAAVFEPAPPPDSEVLRKNTDIPAAFVIEPPWDDRTEYAAGEMLTFDLILIGQAIDLLVYFVVAFQELGRRRGLSPERVRFDLNAVTAINPLTGLEQLVYTDSQPGMIIKRRGVTTVDVEAAAKQSPTDRLTLRFLTPTRIKHQGKYVRRPEFHVLIRALLRRISSLSYFHCGQRWEADFNAIIAAAEEVETTQMAVEWVNWERYSRRQRRRMSLGGFAGEVSYRGDLAPFLPLLILGELVHVGKATVFGNGKYEVSR